MKRVGDGTLSAMLNGNKADGAVICETSERTYNSTYGLFSSEISVKGIALHSGSKWKGVNAIEKAIILIQALS